MNMTELMKDRHIDQILMCSIYVMGKVHLLYFLTRFILYCKNNAIERKEFKG